MADDTDTSPFRILRILWLRIKLLQGRERLKHIKATSGGIWSLRFWAYVFSRGLLMGAAFAIGPLLVSPLQIRSMGGIAKSCLYFYAAGTLFVFLHVLAGILDEKRSSGNAFSRGKPQHR